MTDAVQKDTLPAAETSGKPQAEAHAAKHTETFLTELKAADTEVEQLPAGMHDQLKIIYDGVIGEIAARSDPANPQLRAEALSRALASVPAYPRGKEFTSWSENTDAYRAAIHQINMQYLKEGKFDKEGFSLAAAAEMFKLASGKEDRLADRATFANTLYLMTQVGMLETKDIEGLDNITKTIPEAWKALCKQNLLDSKQISDDDYKKLESLAERVKTFSHTQLVDKDSPSSVVSRIASPNANAIAFRTAYEGPQAKAA